jgi:hypothetical protein
MIKHYYKLAEDFEKDEAFIRGVKLKKDSWKEFSIKQNRLLYNVNKRDVLYKESEVLPLDIIESKPVFKKLKKEEKISKEIKEEYSLQGKDEGFEKIENILKTIDQEENQIQDFKEIEEIKTNSNENFSVEEIPQETTVEE